MTGLTGDLPKGTALGIGVGPAPVGMIEQVENLETELEPLNLPSYWEVLAYPDVPIPETRDAQGIPLLYPEGTKCRLGKRILIEPGC